jgi:hypothetical protein
VDRLGPGLHREDPCPPGTVYGCTFIVRPNSMRSVGCAEERRPERDPTSGARRNSLMKYARFKLLAAWTAGIGLILAQTPANAETPLSSPVNAVSAPQPVPVPPTQSAAPTSSPFAPEVLAQPTLSYPLNESPVKGMPVSGSAAPQLNPSWVPAPAKASRPCLRDRIHSLLEQLNTPWPAITW